MQESDCRVAPADGVDPCHAGGVALPGKGA